MFMKRQGHFTPHRLPFQVPDRMPEQAANASDTEGSLCLYEMVGGTCNDDTCKARHFRDFQGESSSPLAAASASPSSASPSTHVFGK
ncbi:hypothetical protein BCR43DRAFT_482166 [Syncephalastrum racemosum]|uniref:Putative zinc-finger domain-containing protein n=1 Tax=Syncephalastrum racemosum TaxID=13706 RepID=A0A1X2HT89_SYNRA|nr:hypothetical protein BCR43DRAFT_482166 [Syncephalastrum racemosum]